MVRKSLLFVCAVLFVVVLDAEAYFFSATDGNDLFLFSANAGSTGKLAITSEFKYAAPGTIGATALLPASGTTATKRIFDLFGTFVSNGKPAVFRDRVEFDEASQTWRFVSRKLFPTHKLDSFNTFSASVSGNGAQRFLLTENGSNVNRRKVSPSGSLKGGNKATFKNPSQLDPLSAALTPDGAFAVQSSFTRAGSASTADAAEALTFGISLKRLADNQFVNLIVSGEIINTSVVLATASLCFAFREVIRNTGGAGEARASAADKSGIFYVNFDPDTFQPLGNVIQISKMSPTPLAQHEIFNTTLILPDGKGILFAKHKSGKLEYRVQTLDGACGPKKGPAYKLLSRGNPTIANNNPLYGWAAAMCTYPGLC